MILCASFSLDFNKLQSSIGFQSWSADSKVFELTVYGGLVLLSAWVGLSPLIYPFSSRARIVSADYPHDCKEYL